ncbi:MAG TPA: FHA domain-containing protein [Thermoanaerobaculia bacterium]|nr:FHA domain-containing protein [Thermoanaerobaculia bacterium]
MKPILLGGGIVFLALGVLLLIIALVVYLASRNKPAAAAAPYRPMPPQPIPPQRPMPQAPTVPPPAAQPHHAAPPPPPPPPPAAATTVASPPRPSPPGAGDTDSTVVAERLSFGSLQATSGPLAGQNFPLKMDGFYIGRDRSVSQIVIETPSVSKRHVWIGIRDGVPTAIDQSSTNGTYLNTLGTRIGTVRLTPGDTLIISDDVARFVYRA